MNRAFGFTENLRQIQKNRLGQGKMARSLAEDYLSVRGDSIDLSPLSFNHKLSEEVFEGIISEYLKYTNKDDINVLVVVPDFKLGNHEYMVENEFEDYYEILKSKGQDLNYPEIAKDATNRPLAYGVSNNADEVIDMENKAAWARFARKSVYDANYRDKKTPDTLVVHLAR